MKHSRAVLLFSLSTVTSSFAIASDQLEVVTVSALPVAYEDTGSAISIIGRNEIESRGAATLQDLLREVPGLAVSQQGAIGSVAQVRMRGAEANQLLVLINGIEANDLAQGSEFDFSQISTLDIERVEIVRGPQSALWGSDAMAGVINIITLPSQDASDVHVNLEGGSFATYRTGLTATHVNATSTTRFTLDYLDTDGTNISRQGDEDDGLQNLTAGIAGTWRAADNLRLEYTLRHTDKTTEFDGTDFIATGLPTDADNRTESEYLYAGVQVTHDLTDQLHHQLALHRSDSENVTFNGGAAPSIGRGEKTALRYQFNLVQDSHHVSVIAEREEEYFEQRGAASFFGDPNQNRETTTNSLAAEYRFSGENLGASISARRDNNNEFQDASSWRLTGNYRVADNTTLYASAGSSVKNPTFTERFGFFTNFIGNPDLEPEESESIEVGLRQRWDQASFNVAWFRSDLTNEINGFVFDAATGGFTADNVNGKSDRSGVELEFCYQASDNLTLKGGYSYLDATQPDNAGGDVTEVRRPEHSGFFSAAYTQQNWGADLAWTYTGEQDDDYFPPFPPFQERVTLPSFNLVSLSGYYQLNDMARLTLRFENLIDESYEQVYGYQSAGAAAYAGIRLRW